ncbi:hypothetical protein Q31b_16710 [Novipirellula aureliae]|uniref:DUF6868 domain-containing protein n=1 Tax=Novipirellula aureliae TaxID=2527966 RepID=A0A5C6E695_9BACT|nr:hypothetical protein [Novipirellula aureliae]TWU44135.1 hypothetical protein Q31b_16710 [Novipirellula aureliae]
MTDQTKDLLTTLSSILLRCWILGLVLLFVGFGTTQLMGEFMFKLHGPITGLSKHELELIFYCGMGLLKLGIFIFFLIPWISIKLVLRKIQ